MARVIGDIGEIGEHPNAGAIYALSGDEGRPYFSSCDRLDALLLFFGLIFFLFFSFIEVTYILPSS